MLKKIVLLVAVMTGASSVSFGATSWTQAISKKAVAVKNGLFALPANLTVVKTRPVDNDGNVRQSDKKVVAKNRSAIKTVANIAAFVTTVEAGRKIKAALKSDDVKNAEGFKAKAIAFGKGLNLNPRESKVLYGALVAAVAGHTANKLVPVTKYF